LVTCCFLWARSAVNAALHGWARNNPDRMSDCAIPIGCPQ
jgi:hypothetical protein